MSAEKKIYTDSGIEVKPVYYAVDVSPVAGTTRRISIYKRVYSQTICTISKLWTMRQYAGFSTAEEKQQTLSLFIKRR